MANDPFAEQFNRFDFGFGGGNSLADFGFGGGDSSGSTLGSFGEGLFDEFQELEPEIPFQGALDRANLTPNQLQTFRNQRGNIFKQFLGRLNRQIEGGQFPDARFTDFIEDFDFGREFQKFAPSQRIGSVGNFAPPTRVIRR
jgi:hypothetical protein